MFSAGTEVSLEVEAAHHFHTESVFQHDNYFGEQGEVSLLLRLDFFLFFPLISSILHLRCCKIIISPQPSGVLRAARRRPAPLCSGSDRMRQKKQLSGVDQIKRMFPAETLQQRLLRQTNQKRTFMHKDARIKI